MDPKTNTKPEDIPKSNMDPKSLNNTKSGEIPKSAIDPKTNIKSGEIPKSAIDPKINTKSGDIPKSNMDPKSAEEKKPIVKTINSIKFSEENLKMMNLIIEKLLEKTGDYIKIASLFKNFIDTNSTNIMAKCNLFQMANTIIEKPSNDHPIV